LAAREPAGKAHAHALSRAYSSAKRRATSMLGYVSERMGCLFDRPEKGCRMGARLMVDEEVAIKDADRT
jgi:hypothetical protein